MLGKLFKLNLEWYVVESKTVKNCFGCASREVKYYHKIHPEQSKKLFEFNEKDLNEKYLEFEMFDEFVKLKNVDGVIDDLKLEQENKKDQDTIEWDEIEKEYDNDNYPPFGGPFTDAMRPFEWLKLYFKPPIRKYEN